MATTRERKRERMCWTMQGVFQAQVLTVHWKPIWPTRRIFIEDMINFWTKKMGRTIIIEERVGDHISSLYGSYKCQIGLVIGQVSSFLVSLQSSVWWLHRRPWEYWKGQRNHAFTFLWKYIEILTRIRLPSSKTICPSLVLIGLYMKFKMTPVIFSCLGMFHFYSYPPFPPPPPTDKYPQPITTKTPKEGGCSGEGGDQGLTVTSFHGKIVPFHGQIVPQF